jgi:hypothetical protein
MILQVFLCMVFLLVILVVATLLSMVKLNDKNGMNFILNLAYKKINTLLRCVEMLQYSDHNVANVGKFSEFAQQVYMDSIGTGPFDDPTLQPKPWASGLANTGILNLVEIPHFGRGKEVNNYVKQLMAVLHGGFLWLEELVSIDVDLIAFIKGLSSMGESLAQYLDEKTKEKALVEEMNKNYDTERGLCDIIIKRISDTIMIIDTKLMACKMLRKCHKEEVPTGVVAAVT